MSTEKKNNNKLTRGPVKAVLSWQYTMTFVGKFPQRGAMDCVVCRTMGIKILQALKVRSIPLHLRWVQILAWMAPLKRPLNIRTKQSKLHRDSQVFADTR